MPGALLERDPCPDRILDDSGGGFAMGVGGGSAFHFLNGVRNSPNGARIIGGMQAARMNAPRVGGSFAVWAGLYSTFDCTLVYVRQKEDPWNSIMAGASTGGFLSLRSGLRAAGVSAICGGVLLGIIEGVGIITNRMQQNIPALPADDPTVSIATGLPQPPVYPNANPSGRGSWLGGLFGKEEKKPSSSGGTLEILESFETPSPPIPSFEYK